MESIVKIDGRTIINALRFFNPEAKFASITDGEVREEAFKAIYRDIYPNFSTPIETGAFRASPSGEEDTFIVGRHAGNRRVRNSSGKWTSTTVPTAPKERVSNGEITSEGFVFDPYEIGPSGEHHYGEYVKYGDIYLNEDIKDHRQLWEEDVKNILIEAWNDVYGR